MGKQIELLKHHSNPAPDSFDLSFVMVGIQLNAYDFQLTFINAFQPIERADQGAFS